MNIGTKSLLFGVHQFILHPISVLLAWIKLYGKPSWKELICIIIHDWGYFGSPNMDGREGERHPEFAAKIVGKLFGQEYHDLCLYHSRHYARKAGHMPSKLCWADKLCIKYNPWWLYIPLSWLTGELFEYRRNTADAGFIAETATHREWFKWVSGWLIEQGLSQKSSIKLVNNN
jgi:hypothetical protein